MPGKILVKIWGLLIQIADVQNRVVSEKIKIHELAKIIYIYFNPQMNGSPALFQKVPED